MWIHSDIKGDDRNFIEDQLLDALFGSTASRSPSIYFLDGKWKIHYNERCWSELLYKAEKFVYEQNTKLKVKAFLDKGGGKSYMDICDENYRWIQCPVK